MENLIIGLILLIVVATLYLFSLRRADHSKLKKSLTRSLRILIQNSIRLFAIFLIIGMLQNFLSKEAMSNFLLRFRGFSGILAGELAGSIMMGPAASGYPIAKYLFDSGAKTPLVSAFLLSWVMVGIVSMPLEYKDLGRKFMITRNIVTIIGIIFLSLIMGVLI